MPPGWRGDRPATLAEAERRILDATLRCLRRDPTFRTGLTDVAAEVGVTRQTIYRYFPSTEALLAGAARTSVGAYLDRLARHLAGHTDPAAAVVEAIAYTVERLPHEQVLAALLVSGHPASFARNVTSGDAYLVARTMLDRIEVDWTAHGFDDATLVGLSEIGLRTIQSLVLDPGPRRTKAELRAFLDGWIGAAIRARLADAAEG